MKKKIALLGAVALLVSSFDQGLLLAAEQETYDFIESRW